MRFRVLMLPTAVVLAVAVGCGSPTAPTPAAKGKTPPAHDHPTVGPAGGAIVEWGEEDYHLEFIADRAAGEAVVYVLDKTAKAVTAIGSKTLTVSLEGTPPVTVTLEPKPQDGDPAGKSSRFVGKHDALKKDGTLTGSVSGEVDGKKYTGDFKFRSVEKK
jgi:hypothetical protein